MLTEKSVEILIMSDNGLETVGGEQESTKIILNGIKEKYSIGVIQPGEINNPMEGVQYYILTKHTRIKHLIKNPITFLIYIWKAMRVISKVKPKVIHTQAQVSFFIVSFLFKFKLISAETKFIHTERGLFTKYNNIFLKIFYLCMKELDVLVTTTEFNMKYWKKALTNKKINIKYKIIENTAGELFEIYDPGMESNRDEKLVIGFAGRYTNWKNWPLAVEICEKLNDRIGNKLEVRMAVGCLDEKSKIETQKMFDKLTKKLGDRFIGKVNMGLEEMNKFYYKIDFFVLTSNYNTESFGRTLVEAMSRKVVVFTTNSGGSVEVVGNNENVCDNSEEFVEKILTTFNDKQKMTREKENNLTRVREKYSLKNNISKHFDLYKSILQ